MPDLGFRGLKPQFLAEGLRLGCLQKMATPFGKASRESIAYVLVSYLINHLRCDSLYTCCNMDFGVGENGTNVLATGNAHVCGTHLVARIGKQSHPAKKERIQKEGPDLCEHMGYSLHSLYLPQQPLWYSPM